MTDDLYTTGTYAYFEVSNKEPYMIGKIETIWETPNGDRQAKFCRYYRRQDVPLLAVSLRDLRDKVEKKLAERELFSSSISGKVAMSRVRGKCDVSPFHPSQSLPPFPMTEDVFFCLYHYNDDKGTLILEKKEIRVGSQFQADIPPLLKTGESDERDMAQLETLVWNQDSSVISEEQIEQYLLIAKSLALFARALCSSSAVLQTGVVTGAAAARRDITLFHAMDVLHNKCYNISNAISGLFSSSATPVICMDQLEKWSRAETKIFDKALARRRRKFNAIIFQQYLPWKSLQNIIEYYYMRKDISIGNQRKTVKGEKAENQVELVNLSKHKRVDPVQSIDISHIDGKQCRNCNSNKSQQWYTTKHGDLCAGCWLYWKKYGGMKTLDRPEG